MRKSHSVYPRTLVQAIGALKAKALMNQRDFVSPEDITALSGPLFQHRLAIKGGAERAAAIVQDLISSPIDKLISEGLKK